MYVCVDGLYDGLSMFALPKFKSSELLGSLLFGFVSFCNVLVSISSVAAWYY